MNAFRAIKKLKPNQIAIAYDKMRNYYIISRDFNTGKVIFSKNGNKIDGEIPDIIFALKNWKIQTFY